MRVGVLCQDALLRDGLLSLIVTMPQVEIVAADGRFRSISALADIGQVDAIVIPIDSLSNSELMPIQTLRTAKGARLIAISSKPGHQNGLQKIFDAVVPRSAGAHGLKSALSSLRLAPPRASGSEMGLGAPAPVGLRLTRREQQVAQLIAKGMSNRKIAEMLGIREQSVKNLVSVLLRKLECENRVQVALQLSRLGAFTNHS